MKARIFKSISTKLIFVLVFSSLMLGIIISALSYMITWNTYSKFFSNTTENAVRFAATLVMVMSLAAIWKLERKMNTTRS